MFGSKEEPEVRVALDRFFNTDLPAIGADVDRNIYKNSQEVSWPMPPQPIRDGKFVRWRDYRSVVNWHGALINMLLQAGGYRRVIEAVISCRIQDQIDRLECDLLEALKTPLDEIIPNVDPVEEGSDDD